MIQQQPQQHFRQQNKGLQAASPVTASTHLSFCGCSCARRSATSATAISSRALTCSDAAARSVRELWVREQSGGVGSGWRWKVAGRVRGRRAALRSYLAEEGVVAVPAIVLQLEDEFFLHLHSVRGAIVGRLVHDAC